MVHVVSISECSHNAHGGVHGSTHHWQIREQESGNDRLHDDEVSEAMEKRLISAASCGT